MYLPFIEEDGEIHTKGVDDFPEDLKERKAPLKN